MSLADEMQRLARWNGWANRVVGDVLAGTRGQPETALKAFQHVLEAEVTWLRRFEGIGKPGIPLWGPASLETVGALGEEATSLLSSLSASLDDGRLQGTFTYANSAGKQFTDRLQEPLLHMFLHSQQYRGEAAAFLNATENRVPDFDFIFWLRQGEPG
ncbi:MAG: hypothetical protein LC118_14275 [Dehalococcoidia bacterium]|nr:hypothetical protein [Dehalococcoidia bacterium]